MQPRADSSRADTNVTVYRSASMNRVFLILTVLCLILAACAEGTVVDRDINAPEDTKADSSAVDTSTPELDTVSDPGAEVVCSPGLSLCSDATHLEVCTADGTALVKTACPQDYTCVGDACEPPPPFCEANSATCTDTQTLSRCTPGGQAFTETQCSNGRCLVDHCTSGAPTGASCTSGTDCAGGSCLPEGGGYCTTPSCETNKCAPGEVCSLLGLGSATTPSCILGCSGCTGTGFRCASIPAIDAQGAQVWADGCTSLAGGAIGANCTSNDGCMGGLCLLTSPSARVIDGGYCSAPCTTPSGCPPNAACVTSPGYQGGAGFCLLECINPGDGTKACPAERPETFDIDCFTKVPADGGSALSVCFQN